MVIQITKLNMAQLKIFSSDKGEKVEFAVENWFTASENPPYIGIIVKPSPGLWEFLSRTKNVILQKDDAAIQYSIPYRIEVGENSIFFLTPKE